MTPFGGAVTVLLMPFIAFRFGQALWDVTMLWRQLITAPRLRRRLDRELDRYGQRGTVAEEFAELMAARNG